MTKINGNGWLKFWPIAVAIAIIISNWAVQGSDVKTLKEACVEAKKERTYNKEEIIKIQKDKEYIVKSLDEIRLYMKDQELLNAEITQIAEYIKTTHSRLNP